ncbi:MAG: apolipoprotein N-acyltransferase [Actinomycetota bacterium]|nr:apolipoprotein N-acyltransferase [Actinomycetota bacterium]
MALVPLLVGAHGTDARRGFRLGFLFGIGFFGMLIYWFSIVGWIAWALAVGLESLFTGLFGAAWAVTSRWMRGMAIVPSGAALWVALEYVRSRIPFGGFTWGELAQSQHNLPWMLRSASIAGAWGTAFLIVSAACCLVCALAARYPQPRRAAAYVIAAAAFVALPLLAPQRAATGRALRVAIVQGNVPRSFTGGTIAKEKEIIRSHIRLTRQLAAQHPDLVVWPESAVGIDLRTSPGVAAAVESAARAVHAPMIVGGDLDIDAAHYKVVAFLISPRGIIDDVYQKTHLVPFGEYVPGRKLLGWIPLLNQIPQDAVPAKHGKLFSVDGAKVAPVLSFEGDFGSLVRSRIHAGGRLLVVATNTSTWGTTRASAQHVAMSQVRAAENGVWVVHAALSGISAFIAPDGTVVRSTPLWKATSIVQKVRFARSISFYARTGDWLPILCLIASLAMVVVGITRSRIAARE